MLLTLKDVFNAHLAKTSAGGTYDDLKGIVVDPGDLIKISYSSAKNNTTACTKLEIGYTDGALFTPLQDELTITAGLIYASDIPFLVPEGKRVTARLTGCTAGDYLEAHFQGFIYFLGE
jgi:uncharacterized protein (DUF697 family)